MAKKYKVIYLKTTTPNKAVEKMEDALNAHSADGWNFRFMTDNFIVFDRD